MKIKKYFDLEFLENISKDANALQKLCNEDSGFILKRLQDSNILPEKAIIENIDSHAAIIFLF